MRIRTNARDLNREAEELLSVSRTVKQVRDEVTEVRRQLRQLSQLDECRLALGREADALSLTSGRITALSSALREVARLYGATEERNEELLEEDRRTIQSEARVVVFDGRDNPVRRQIHQILYK